MPIADVHSYLQAVLKGIEEARHGYAMRVGAQVHAAAEMLPPLARETSRNELKVAADCAVAARDLLLRADGALALAEDHITSYLGST